MRDSCTALPAPDSTPRGASKLKRSLATMAKMRIAVRLSAGRVPGVEREM